MAWFSRARNLEVLYNELRTSCRGVAKPGIAPALGAGGPRFKSGRPDHNISVRPGDIGDSSYRRHGLHFWAERIFDRFEHSSLQIKVSQIIIHKAHQPNVVVDFSDADGLTGEDRTEVDFLAAQTDSTTTRDHDGFVVEWIVDVRQPLVGTCGRLIDL